MNKLWILFILIILAMISGCAVGPNAKSHFKTATELHPQDGNSFFDLCVEYQASEQYQEAIEACKQSLSLPHNQIWNARIWDVLASSQEKLGQIDSAISSQQKIVALLPDNYYSFEVLARYYYKNKQYDEAITAAKRAIELKSDNAVAYVNLGEAYGMKKQYDEAIKALQKAIEIDPKMSTAYGSMGRFFTEQDAYVEAAEAYKKGIETAPSDPNPYEGLAIAYYKMGRYDDAIAAINKAIELQTITRIGIHIFIVDGYPVVTGVVNNGPAKKADIQVGDKIIEIDGKSTAGWNEEKVIQNIKGTVDTQVILTIERNDNKIKKTVAGDKIVQEGAASRIGVRSLIHRGRGNKEESFKDAEKAYSLDSANDYARLSLGATYLDRGQYDESIKLLSQIKDSAVARLLEATAYAKQGKTKEAINIYLSIPEEKLSPKDVPLMNDRMVLLQTFKPIVKEHRDKATSLESKGQEKEALTELSEALKIADDTEVQDIQETIFSMIRRNPLLAEVPEDAREYALRSEVLVKEGSFEQAATEINKAIQIAPYAARLYYNAALINAELKKYPEAISHMKIYIKASPDAPDVRAAKDEIIKWKFLMEKGK